jgi:hypothetical protein
VDGADRTFKALLFVVTAPALELRVAASVITGSRAIPSNSISAKIKITVRFICHLFYLMRIYAG